jgi:hypothetical protein
MDQAPIGLNLLYVSFGCYSSTNGEGWESGKILAWGGGGGGETTANVGKGRLGVRGRRGNTSWPGRGKKKKNFVPTLQ